MRNRLLFTHPALVNIQDAAFGEAVLNAMGVYTTGETPQEIMSQVIHLSECCDLYSTIMNVNNTFMNAVSEAQNNANYTKLTSFTSQYVQPKQLANYYVGCDNIGQKTHQKLAIGTSWAQYYKARKHYLETHHLGVYRTPISKRTSTPMS